MGLIDDAHTAVGGGVPGVGAGILLLQDGSAGSGGDVVLLHNGAALGVVGIEEELVILGADLADGTAGEVGNAGIHIQTQPCGVGVVGASGQTRADHAHAGAGVSLLVIEQCHGGGEAAHGVTADRDDAVALRVLLNVGLLIHIDSRVINGGGPEIHEAAGVFRIALGVAVVIHIQSQNNIAPAGQLDGGSVLHFGAVQVAVSGDNGGPGVAGVRALGQVQQAGQGAALGVKVDPLYLDGVEAGVEDLCGKAAQKHQHKADDENDCQQIFLLFHLKFSLLLFAVLANCITAPPFSLNKIALLHNEVIREDCGEIIKICHRNMRNSPIVYFEL